MIKNTFWAKKNFLPLKGQGLSLWKACSLQRLSPRSHFGLKIQKKIFWSEIAWNVFKIDSSKIGFYQNFLIYCDKFDNKIIYCLARFRAGNFSPAPTSIAFPALSLARTHTTTGGIDHHGGNWKIPPGVVYYTEWWEWKIPPGVVYYTTTYLVVIRAYIPAFGLHSGPRDAHHSGRIFRFHGPSACGISAIP